MPDSAAVEYELRDGIARVRLNRPHKLNAVTPRLVEELCRALDAAARDEAGAVVLSGRGRAFCAGHDLRHEEPPVDEAEERRRLQRLQDVTRKIRRMPGAVVAAVHGYALGAGCEFALCSDLILAARTAQFGFPEVGVGLGITGGMSHVLPLTVGLARARELVLLGERFDAARALDLGLVNQVVEDDELEEVALEVARTLRDRPRTALKLAKYALDGGAQSDIDEAYEVEVTNAMTLHRSADARRAEEAFRERTSRSRGDA
jgi:enoyl-CoA hydratase/carnithine racemase